jgi:hypothetical protein
MRSSAVVAICHPDVVMASVLKRFTYSSISRRSKIEYLKSAERAPYPLIFVALTALS